MNEIDPLDFILYALTKHNIPALRSGDEVRLRGHDLRFEAGVHEEGGHGDVVVLVLEIRIRASAYGDQPIIESFAGIGDTARKAFEQAASKFLLGVFHPVIEALTDHRCDQMQADVEHWQGSTGGWKVYAAPWVVHGDGRDVFSPHFQGLHDGLQALFTETVAPGSHFIRVFLAGHAGEMMSCEVLLDNEVWEEGAELVARQPWVFPQSYNTLRAVFIALPEGGALQ